MTRDALSMLRGGVVVSAIAIATACGGGSRPANDAGVDGEVFDAASCGVTQCDDCLDNDRDGTVDGFDVECTGAHDDDEASFETGIPGSLDGIVQDCFFDANTGNGDDGCEVHVCCELGATSRAECPVQAELYDPAACPPPIGTATLPSTCVERCAPLTPPNCDCFGCCTVCDAQTSTCFDVDIHPAIAPNCDASIVSSAAACPRCTKTTACAPIACASCATSADCPGGYCARGCCIGVAP